MDIVNKIRKEFRAVKKINPVARKFNCSWATVNSIVNLTEDDFPKRGGRKKLKVISSIDVENRINQIFDEEESQNVHRKQKHKSPAIFKKLKEEKYIRALQDILEKLLNVLGIIEKAQPPKRI